MKTILIVSSIILMLVGCEVQSSKRLVEICATSKKIDLLDTGIKNMEKRGEWDLVLHFERSKKLVYSRTLKQNLEHTGKYELLYKECEFEQKRSPQKFKNKWS